MFFLSGVLNVIPDKIMDLFNILEYSYNPISLCKNVDEILKEIEIPTLSANSPIKQIKVELYANDIRRNAALVMFKQLSLVSKKIENNYLKYNYI